MKALTVVGAILALVVVVAIAVATIVGVPAGMVNAALRDRIAPASGMQVTVKGATRIGLFPLRVIAHDIAVEEPGGPRVAIPRVEAHLPLADVFSGNPKIQRLTLVDPVAYVPLRRERGPVAAPTAGAASPMPSAFPDTIAVRNGALVFTAARDGVENRADGIDADVVATPDRLLTIKGAGRLGDRRVAFNAKTAAPIDAPNIPVEIGITIPDIAPVSARAELRVTGAVLHLNGLSGSVGDGAFTGWGTVDFASKPLVKLDLDFQKLALGGGGKSDRAADAPWSNAPLDLTGLNYVDAQLRASAAELTLADARIAPAVFDIALRDGKLKAAFSNLGIYGGKANGDFAIDASGARPDYAMLCDFDGVRALPLLSGLAQFDKIDGAMRANLALRGNGDTIAAIMRSLSGSASVGVRDGEIRGINVARTIRSLTASTLSGWQDNASESTDLTELAATFRVEGGQATTNDFSLAGPLVRMPGAGIVDLGNKTLAFRLDPKVVMTTQGQGGAAAPVGLGVPVIVRGTWSQPQIYPDVAGILDNPDAAYAQLRTLGQGLFGTAGGNTPGGGTLGDTLGTLLQQGVGGASRPGQPGQPGQRPTDPAGSIDGIMKQLFGR